MKLYWGPHTCAIGIHILLEEIGKPYETHKLDIKGGETHAQPFLALNPKGKVPILVRDDGSVLTEFGAIATWLARTLAPHLLPADPNDEARAIDLMDYTIGTVHAQGFGRVFKPEKFEPQDPVHQTLGLGKASVKQQGREMIEQGFAIIDRQLAGKSYAGGNTFGIADTALFYVERWAPEVEINLPPNVSAHFERMKARPAVQRVLALWGEA